MSVLNQMLRDLEKRGAMPDVVAAAGTATVARPTLSLPPRAVNLRRYWIWVAVLAIGAGFVGVHSWLNYRVQDAGTPRAPLGARQFGSVVAPETAAASAAPVKTAPVAAVAAVGEPATRSTPVAPQEAPKVNAAPARRPGPTPTAPAARPAPTPLSTPAPAPAAQVATAEPTEQAVVARSSSDVARDVDRAADLIARGRATEAMDLLVQVLNRQPTHLAARSSLAALLAEAGRREQALLVLLAGSEADPGRFAMPAAQLQAEMGNLNGALQTLARVSPARRSAPFEALHAGLAQRVGDHMTAINSYRRALARPQAEAVWWVGLALSLEATGEPAEARNAYTRAMADAKLPADVRRYVADRLTVLDTQSQRGEETRRAAMANVF
jgi:MSHA biogenesis protein MshN